MICREKQEMLAVREKPGPAMRSVFARLKLGQAHWRPARRGDSPQNIAVIGLVNNHVVLIPCPSPWIGRLRQNGHRTARRRNLLQMGIREESQEFSIGGPERKRGAFRALEFLGCKVGKRLYPD